MILIHLIVIILVISILIDKSPWIFFSGLGSMTAVLLLVFRDSLLSLVAGLQLTVNNYVRVGDWIELPQFNANGTVIDIALHAVRVENQDKTMTVIPTHKFLEHSFMNWRNMEVSGGQRIQMSIYIDHKLSELKEEKVQGTENSRRLTNIETFCAYLSNYLCKNVHIRQNMTFMARQLAPTPEGVPLEIYVLVNDTGWSKYEAIQSDIFDHVLAVASEFDLKVYQKPSGLDFMR